MAVEELWKGGQCDKSQENAAGGGGRQNRVCALKTSEIKYKNIVNIILRSNTKAPANTSATILILILVANSKYNPSLSISHSFISVIPSRTGTQAFIYPTALLPVCTTAIAPTARGEEPASIFKQFLVLPLFFLTSWLFQMPLPWDLWAPSEVHENQEDAPVGSNRFGIHGRVLGTGEQDLAHLWALP